MIEVNIKPMSVNEAWKGKRYKTDNYTAYEQEIFYRLPQLKIPDGNLELNLEFGVSNIGMDLDNPIKPFVDILQKKYGFNDNRITMAFVKKVKTKKGGEYIKFQLNPV